MVAFNFFIGLESIGSPCLVQRPSTTRELRDISKIKSGKTERKTFFELGNTNPRLGDKSVRFGRSQQKFALRGLKNVVAIFVPGAQQTAKEQIKMPRFILEGPRLCTIIA